MSLTTFPHVEQRSPEWFEQRRGMVTASVVGQLLTTEAADPISTPCPECRVDIGFSCLSLSMKKPTPIKSYHDARRAAVANQPDRLVVADNDTSRALTAALVAERITGHVEPGYVNNDMLRGIYEEPRAIEHYEQHTGSKVETCGFMRYEADGIRLGFSPDGLVGSDGLIEVKAPRAKTHLLTILSGEVPARHMAQIQAGLLVSGREWCDFVSFCGGLPLFVKRVTYDGGDYMGSIWEAVAAFEKRAAEMEATYRARVEGLPVPERIDYFNFEEITAS